jgi:selenocysteine-specific translation elongation factor
MDLPGATENLKALQGRFPKVQVLPTAAATGQGIAALKRELATRMTNEILSGAI